MLKRSILLILLLAILNYPTSALADHSASAVTLLSEDGDYFWNWDFNSESVSPTNVDWPISLLWFNDADVTLVKDIVEWNHVGGEKHARLKDGPGSYRWDSDRGIKEFQGTCTSTVQHMRVYADGDDRIYNTMWGYYVLATAHYDVNELCNSSHGWTEDVTANLVDIASAAGYSVVDNDPDLDFANYETTGWEGNHYVQSDGYASSVDVQ